MTTDKSIAEMLDEAQTLALTLELAIAGGLATDVIDDGTLGQSLRDHAILLQERLTAISEAYAKERDARRLSIA